MTYSEDSTLMFGRSLTFGTAPPPFLFYNDEKTMIPLHAYIGTATCIIVLIRGVLAFRFPPVNCVTYVKDRSEVL